MPAPKDPEKYKLWIQHLKENHADFRGEKSGRFGKPPWNVGLTKETDEKVRKGAKKREGLIPWNKGLMKETDERVEKAAMKIRSNLVPSYGEKNGMYGRCGELNPFYGRHHTEENKALWRQQAKERVGPKSSNWHGGVSFEEYPQDFSEELKELIRLRDGYKCQKCGCPEIENGEKLSIHHINYDKKNCLPSNLVALCRSCNAQVNSNRRKWKGYFRRKLRIVRGSRKETQLCFRK